MALTERQEDDNINSYIQEGAFGVKGKSMRTLEEVKRRADGFRKLYDDARVFGVKDGRKVRADDTAGECYACLRNGYPCRKCVAANQLKNILNLSGLICFPFIKTYFIRL